MGMYCCCGIKIRSEEYEGKPQCSCDWDGWISTCDWPPERKNQEKPISEPLKDGIYLTRTQDASGDRYEKEKTFSVKPRIENCGFTGISMKVHWEGNPEEQPYAWKERFGS